MEQTERIARYEAMLEKAGAALRRFDSALDEYLDAQDEIRALDAYYGSPEWKQDFADDEAGLLPQDLKRGVLSEDGIYDVLSDHYALTVRLLDTVSAILKNR